MLKRISTAAIGFVRRLGAQKDVYLPGMDVTQLPSCVHSSKWWGIVIGVSKRTLRNLNAYIYGGLLPWELEPQLEPKVGLPVHVALRATLFNITVPFPRNLPKDLLPCVVELTNAAKFMDSCEAVILVGW